MDIRICSLVYFLAAGAFAAPNPLGYNPGQWYDWAQWSACSVSCGQGQKSRNRECSAPNTCHGSTTESQACFLTPCVNWNPWGHWTACSATCGAGTRSRSRFCPNYYGCQGDRSQEETCSVGPCAQHHPWEAWGKCSKPCGGGVKLRVRKCSHYGQCDEGTLQDSLSCNEHSCCTNWGRWSQCSVTCGLPEDGFEKSTRRCTIELPGSGPYGYASKEEVQKRPCRQPLQPCVQWSEWGDWGVCSKECGMGERTRERFCAIPGLCPGQSNQAEICNDHECPKWRDWAGWSICDKSCGGGVKKRERICSIDGSCDGDPFETVPCNAHPCPEWSPWAPWTRCSESCGGGWQRRTRVCNGIFCPGDAREKRLCNTHECPQMSEWEEWGTCSAPCGGGHRIRTRPCQTDPEFCQGDNVNSPACLCDGRPEQGEPCNTHKCASYGQWEQWGRCSAECGGGVHTRYRKCLNDHFFCVGPNRNHPSCLCEGPDSDEGRCNEHQCPIWSEWQDWGECNAPCGGGARERKRTCIRDGLFCVGENLDLSPSCQCQGLDISKEQCNAHQCPFWSFWGAWSECNADCGGGSKLRSRGCEADPVFCSGANLDSPACQCEGVFEEEAGCNEYKCAEWAHWSAWSTCDRACGNGQQSRTRKCEPDLNHCYGSALFTDPGCQCFEGVTDETQGCNNHTCAFFTDWTDWGHCSVSCGGGKTQRVRDCQMTGDHCTGDMIQNDPESCQCQGEYEEFDVCNDFQCAYWSEWGDWSECSTTCSTGFKDRKRVCNADPFLCDGANGSPECSCEGTDVDLVECNEGPCHEWAGWSSWSDCSQVCGGGSRNRARECPVPGGCPGLGEEDEFCNQMPCPDWGSWSPWSSCSITCGGGRRARTRSCPLKGGCKPGEALEYENCNDDSCPVWAQWGSWGSCSRTCGEGMRVRNRPCGDDNTPQDACLGRGEDEEACFEAACELQTHWSAWSPCTKTCGGGVKHRSRVSCPTCPPEDETMPCEEGPCPEWSTWEPWGLCSKTCGGGQRTRNRFCSDLDGLEIPRGCVGRKVEIDPVPCSSDSCRG